MFIAACEVNINEASNVTQMILMEGNIGFKSWWNKTI